MIGSIRTVGQHQRPFEQSRYHVGWLLLHGYMLILLIPVCSTAGHELRPGTDLAANNESIICKSVDIRNSIETFDRLKGCHVVEGFVQILLFDNVNESLFANLSFPNLTEITDYLLLYRVNGLRSLGKLFPNLAVIRGQNPLFTYSFVVFEMSSLQEIALYSLTDITHGLIRIDKNPSLCFVNSIDWDRIAHEKGEHFVKSIKPENECPLCPGEDIKDDKNEPGLKECPVAPYKPDDSVDKKRYLCWNRLNCQKVCPKGCSACNERNECCDKKCLGGCVNRRDNCTVCRDFTFGSGHNRQCMTNCPGGFYEYLERRCIRREECTSMKRPIELLHPRTEVEYPYKIFNNKSCVLQCPTNYMDDYVNHTCKPCDGRCKKVCAGTNVDSLQSAQTLRGCTHIKGSLEIQIRGGRNIVNELEENLNMIEEIDGYIKIVRSFSLVSLNFLKNLRHIHGKQLESQKYAFVVLDNQNLQNLWDWKNHTLKIDKGRLFFHFNPKLCLYKIEQLRQEANLSEFTELEVASNSNGDKIACNMTELVVNILDTKSKAVILAWDPFKIDDQRKLLGYIVYSIKAPSRNITLYDGRDACGGDGWRVDDVPIPEDHNTTLTYLLPNLEPYTQYAYYVKTYTIATERHGAQSNISYFRTLAHEPTEPQNLRVTSNDSDSLIISWDPPLKPHGNLTHYIVTGYQHKDSNEDLLSNRNYCSNGLISEPLPAIEEKIIPPKVSNDSCVCDDGTKASVLKIIEEKEAISQITFEDALHNLVYVKRTDIATRRKREVVSAGNTHAFPKESDRQQQTENNTIRNVTEKGTDIWESFNFRVNGKTELHLNRLHHFTQYNIYVQACREKDGDDDHEKLCSTTALKTARTLKKKNADDIDKIQITNQSLQMVTISWEEPPDPNGLILTYEIEYKRTDVENFKGGECITRKNFSSSAMSYTIRNLHPGNYSLRLYAVSQAGHGNYSPFVYFNIEESKSSTVPQMISIFIGLLVIGGVAGFCFWRRRNDPSAQNMKLITQINPEYVSTVYIPDEWEVPRKKIELIKELGQGSFGMVYEGLAKDIQGKQQVRCAIKTVNEHATNRERIEFLNEASVMKAFDTAHVVRLLGVVSQGQPTLVVMELMANGDLKSYLRSHRPDAETYDPSPSRQPPTLKQILQMAIEIADGMSYLAAKKFVHRDLAARNCMVAEDLTVKIGDFGMTRDIYETDYYRKGTKGLLPVRWMAPESLKDGVFTSNSDVWSYGVVLWEMATLASQPYQGLSNDQVLRYVTDGGVMERPENCPDKLYMLMRYCWQHKPTARPSFLELCNLLLEDASPNFAQVSFYHSAAGMEARTVRPTPSPSQDDPSTPLRVDLERSDGESENELDFDTDTRMEFPPFMPTAQDASATVNGYVSGRPTNGTATTQY